MDSIRIEASDYIGHIEGARSIGKSAAGEVFIDDAVGRIVICQPDRCLVIG